MIFKGHPVILDRVFRPLARIVFTGAGVIGSAILAALGWWWWMPMPFVLSLLVFEVVFWIRGDRPMVLQLDGSNLRLTDKVGSQNLSVDLRDVHCATLLKREASDGIHLGLKLSSQQGPLLVIHLMTQQMPTVPGQVVDLDKLGAHVGPILGVVGGLCARNKRVRQVFSADKLLPMIIEQIDPSAWSRLGIRLWRGQEPDLDLVGYHQGEPSHWVVFEGDKAHLSSGQHTTTLACGQLNITSRTRVAKLGWDVDEDAQEETLSMMRIECGDLVVCFRTEPDKVRNRPKRAGAKTDYHTEAIEGACLWASYNLDNTNAPMDEPDRTNDVRTP